MKMMVFIEFGGGILRHSSNTKELQKEAVHPWLAIRDKLASLGSLICDCDIKMLVINIAPRWTITPGTYRIEVVTYFYKLVHVTTAIKNIGWVLMVYCYSREFDPFLKCFQEEIASNAFFKKWSKQSLAVRLLVELSTGFYWRKRILNVKLILKSPATLGRKIHFGMDDISRRPLSFFVCPDYKFLFIDEHWNQFF